MGKRRRVDNNTPQPLADDEGDEIQFISFTQRPISYVPSNTPLINVGIFWDIENLMVPRNVHPANLVNELRRRVIDCQPHFREAEFYVVCDVTRESVRTINQLFEFHVRIVHVPATKQNTSDNVLRDLMVEFVGHHSGKCPRVVLLSGDSDFSHDIHNFTRKERCDVVLVHNPQAKESMVSAATSAFLFEELFQLGDVAPTGWQYDQQRARQGKRKPNKPNKPNTKKFPVVTQIPNQTYTPLSTPSKYANINRKKAGPIGNTPSSRFFNRAAHPNPEVMTLNTSASHLPEFIPVQSKAQKFYRQAKRKMLGKGRSPMSAKNMFSKAKNKKQAAIEFRYP